MPAHDLASIPKAELHQHVDGSIPVDLCWSLMQSYGLSPMPTPEDLGKLLALQPEEEGSLLSYLDKFHYPLWITQFYENIQDVTRAIIEDAHDRCGVRVLELRYSPIIHTYAGSICLIQGSYGFGKLEGGKWVFLREASPELLDETGSDKVPLAIEGDGPLFKIEYTGTGFLAGGKGIVLTNRHIAEPWWHNEAAEPLVEGGFEPRFFHLRAYFPGRKKPYDFDLSRTILSDDADLAALRFTPDEEFAPPLALADPRSVIAGRRVLLLGYPSGLDALIARTGEEFARSLMSGGGLKPAAVLDKLAARGFVRPLPTQGHLSDVIEDKVLFDAPTAVGGSGGPLVDMDGKVVAINYGILKAFSGANFGVPVAYARQLLEKAESAPGTR